MRLACVVFVAACWTSSEPRRTPPPADDRPVHRDPFPARSKWSGVYRCSQGWTAVVLELVAQPGGSLAATFTFGPTPENTQIPIGSYQLAGTIRAFKEGTFQIALQPLRWISQPDGYTMVPMSATSSRRWQRLVGRIEHPTCGELDVRRAD